MKKENNGREKYIDVARGVVILLMLLGHTEAPDWIIQGIYGFHMPFFFILSGMLYDKDKWQNLGLKQLMLRRYKSYVVPYFILSFINLIINLPIEIISDQLRGKQLIISTIKHVFWIFYSFGSASKTPNCTPLWFLLCLFICNIYLYWLFKIKNVSIQIFICIMASVCDYVLYKANVIQLPWHIDIALLGVTFMYIGYWLKRSNLIETMSKKVVLIIGLIIIGLYTVYTNPRIDLNPNIVNNIVLMYIGALSSSISIILVVNSCLKNNKVFEFLGKNTILFMAFNYAVNTYTQLVWNKIPIINQYEYSWWMCFVLDVLILSGISIIWVKLKKIMPAIALF